VIRLYRMRTLGLCACPYALRRRSLGPAAVTRIALFPQDDPFLFITNSSQMYRCHRFVTASTLEGFLEGSIGCLAPRLALA